MNTHNNKELMEDTEANSHVRDMAMRLLAERDALLRQNEELQYQSRMQGSALASLKKQGDWTPDIESAPSAYRGFFLDRERDFGKVVVRTNDGTPPPSMLQGKFTTYQIGKDFIDRYWDKKKQEENAAKDN